MLEVMTFNLRFENDHDGENSWDYRKELVTGLVDRHRPWVLGTQEGTTPQLRYLREHLDGYELFAPGRYWEESCQYCSLHFRPDRVRAVSGGEFWLSPTPEVHRSMSWDSAFPRMISFGVFEELGSGRQFWAGVTHLDNVGTVARYEQAAIIMRRLRELSVPKILVGDFNDRPGSPAHVLLTRPEDGMFDSWEILRRPENSSSMTYHKFQGTPQVCRMDWILVSRDFAVMDARIIYDHSAEGRYPSDHFPYMVRVAWA
jgi:endonuclease/exonuclease/phosphatase family metal-dependent hydrolase